MWPRPMFLLCLIAALSGTPLRQAEAAGDLARSLAELDDDRVIEMVDGGVGDDSGAGVLKDGTDARALLRAPLLTPTIAPLSAPPPSASSPPGADDRRRADRSDPLRTIPARRRAWLQRFLF